MKIAAIYDLTGDQSSLDLPSSKGALLAEKVINESGLYNESLHLIVKDGETNIEVIKNKVHKVLEGNPDLDAFIGLSDSDQLLAAAEEAAEQSLVFMTSGATSPKLVNQIPEYLFLACFGDNVQAAATAEWAYNQSGLKTASILYDSVDTYTLLLEGYFRERFEELGGKVVSRHAFNSQTLEETVQSVESADMIFFSCLPQHVKPGIELLRDNGHVSPIFGGDSFDGLDFWDNNDVTEVYYTTHAYISLDNPNPAITTFIDEYKQANEGEMPTAFSALGYDAVQLIVMGLQNQMNSNLSSLQEGLYSAGVYNGITGKIQFEQNNRIPKKSVTIMKVSDGILNLAGDIIPEKVPNP